MSETSLTSLEIFKDQFVKLVVKHKKLQDEYEELKEENEGLRRQNEEVSQKLTESEAQYERLKFAKAFCMSSESKKQAHRRLTNLVREIDTCIAILKK